MGVNIGLMVLSGTPKRGYHHGDLRNALIQAAASLASESGPGSVTVRAAARVVGVTPTAAYRHFAGHEELMIATRDYAFDQLGAAMVARLSLVPDLADPRARALARLGAFGRGYLDFALEQPGLFRTSCAGGVEPLPKLGDLEPDSGFGMLVRGMDELVEVGLLAPERRPFAEFVAWSTVHGFALLVLNGQLHELDEDTRDAAFARVLEVVGEGLGSTGLSDELRAALVDIARRKP